jgi:hypothetical protein
LAKSQNKDNDCRFESLVRLEIINVLYEFGSYCISLTQEGLLCRKYNYTKDDIQFIPFKKLNRIDLKNLECYLINNDYFKKDTVIDDPNIWISGLPLRVVIRPSWGKFVKIKFYDNKENYDQKLDSLITLTNQLIPKKYRKK